MYIFHFLIIVCHYYLFFLLKFSIMILVLVSTRWKKLLVQSLSLQVCAKEACGSHESIFATQIIIFCCFSKICIAKIRSYYKIFDATQIIISNRFPWVYFAEACVFYQLIIFIVAPAQITKKKLTHLVADVCYALLSCFCNSSSII